MKPLQAVFPHFARNVLFDRMPYVSCFHLGFTPRLETLHGGSGMRGIRLSSRFGSCATGGLSCFSHLRLLLAGIAQGGMMLDLACVQCRACNVKPGVP